jgi:peptidoglycan/xylan/chitin deacetylase (PgdA/CDA1 family)
MNVCKTVVYHYVREIKNSQYKIKGMEVEDFEKQIKLFKKKYVFIGIRDIVEAINDNKKIPENSILLTFDDGLKDHFQNVFPLLKENNIEGLFFPSGKPIIEKMVLDVHKIQFILASIDSVEKIILEIKKQLDYFKNEYGIYSFNEYYRKYAIKDRFDSKEIMFIKKLLQKGLPRQLRSKIVNILFKKFVTNNEEKFSKNLYLSIDEIRQMKQSGMNFGSHSYSHYWMATLNEKELNQEFVTNEKFEKNISREFLSMCYPYGSYNELVMSKLKQNNFQFGLTTEVGDSVLNNENRFRLKRYDCNDFPIENI